MRSISSPISASQSRRAASRADPRARRGRRIPPGSSAKKSMWTLAAGGSLASSCTSTRRRAQAQCATRATARQKRCDFLPTVLRVVPTARTRLGGASATTRQRRARMMRHRRRRRRKGGEERRRRIVRRRRARHQERDASPSSGSSQTGDSFSYLFLAN